MNRHHANLLNIADALLEKYRCETDAGLHLKDVMRKSERFAEYSVKFLNVMGHTGTERVEHAHHQRSMPEALREDAWMVDACEKLYPH